MKNWFAGRRRRNVLPPDESGATIEAHGNVLRVVSFDLPEGARPGRSGARPLLREVPRPAGEGTTDRVRPEILPLELLGAVQPDAQGPRLPRRGFLRAFLQTALLVSGAGLSVVGTAAADDGSLWDERQGFRYTNRKAMAVGDLITVLVTESSSGSNRSSLSTSKEHKVDVEGGPGAGPLDFIPLFGVESNAKNELSGSGQVSVSGQLTTTLTVEVREIRPNGYLVVEGSRLIDLNGEQEQVTLHGVARPEDIRSDNSVLSTKLSEVRIAYSGKGAGKSASRPGVFARILGWIF